MPISHDPIIRLGYCLWPSFFFFPFPDFTVGADKLENPSSGFIGNTQVKLLDLIGPYDNDAEVLFGALIIQTCNFLSQTPTLVSWRIGNWCSRRRVLERTPHAWAQIPVVSQ